MLSSREFTKEAGRDERGWLSGRQLAAVLAFVALFVALVVWTTVATPGPIADFEVERLVRDLASSTAAAVESDHSESP